MKPKVVLPGIFAYICGTYFSIQYSALYSLSAIPFAMFSSLFLWPPILLFFVSEIKFGPTKTRFYAFALVVLAEIIFWVLYYLSWTAIPDDMKDGEVGEILWFLLKFYLAGVAGTFFGLVIFPKIREYL